mmetsp:Transcript_26811/g.34353  ORF Transcript_26811/g.34353 Transcript_26811/m.34353 type:complete len:302 (+) Transcript_26811:592-1497(+)
MHMSFNTSNRFAEHISKRSSESAAIAVLSYDKRGVGRSQPMEHPDKNYHYRAGMMDFVLDAVEAVRFVSSHPQIDKSKIIVMGHSEGAIIMPLICKEVTNDPNLDPIYGCIFYSGFGETLKDAMELQRSTLLNEVTIMTGLQGWILRKLITKEKLEKQSNDLLEKINGPDEPDFISMQCGFSKQPAKWIREHFAYDVHEALSQHITCHCLAITGQKDFQVRNEFCTSGKAAELVPHAKSTEMHRPTNLTHALRSMEGDCKIMNLKKDYARMGKLPLDEELLKITDAWLDRVLLDDVPLSEQ